ncbi:MAG: SpoIIE family protein phosphatase, partial [Bacteroidia bacterium]|nr:SpoIIE family protein phosphatase [Bacteroidia bacterium]
GTYGGGLNLFNEKTRSFSAFKHNDVDPSSISSDDVWCIKEDKEGNLWIGTWGGGLNKLNIQTKKFSHYKFDAAQPSFISNDRVISLLVDDKGTVYAGTNGGGLNVYNKTNNSFVRYKHSDTDSLSISSDRVRCIIQDSKNNIWIGTDGGGYNLFDPIKKNFTHFTEKDGLCNNVVYGIVEDDLGNLWFSTNGGISKYNFKRKNYQNFDVRDGLQSNEFNQGAFLRSGNGKIYFGGVNGFNVFEPSSIQKNPNRPPVYITSIKLFNNEIVKDTMSSFIKELNLNYSDNFLSFEFAALDYTSSDKNKYACKMEGFDKDWIELGNRRFISYTNLDPGKYVFRVKGSNNDGVWNEQGNYIVITIAPPFWKTIWFYLTMIALVVLGIYAYIQLRTKKLQRDKRVLEKEVENRTHEIVFQKNIIERKNKDITDSITYAKRIQQAILPSVDLIKKMLPESFVLYKPKDIVSGDFYWMEQSGTQTMIAAVDCTGHGVPGAFMSIVGYNLLNQAVNERGLTKPSSILDEMNKGILKQLKQQTEEHTVRDGMDMSLCTIDFKTKTLQYAGANNSLWIIRAGELIVLKADKQPIGSFYNDEIRAFTNHEFQLQQDDHIYLFTDGYADQFGGQDGKKFKYKKLQELLLSCSGKGMEQQLNALDQTIEQWKGNLEQVDDILIIGIKV